MRGQGWLVRAGLGLLGWAGIGLGVADAQGIPPVDATTGVPISSTVTVSIFQEGGRNVTDAWLPEPGQTVTIGVNVGGAPVSATIALVSPGASQLVRTSAYPGVCTNSGSSVDFSPDFTLNANELTSTDCGGRAVIQVTGTGVSGEPFTFVVPRDSDFDGIPDIYEARFCPATSPNCLVADADIDAGASSTAPIGDGITNFDEYRGFMVSGKHVRTNPTQKDLFVHLVNPADSINGVFVTSARCETSCFGGGTVTYPTPTAPNATLTLPAAAGTAGTVGTFTTNTAVFGTAHVRGEIIGNAGGLARIVSVASATSVTAEVMLAFPGTTALSAGQWKVSESLFANVFSLVPPERVHLLGYAPGATSFLTTEWVEGFVSLVPSQTLTVPATDPPDRTVNANRVYGPVQRGVRVMEGLNTESTSVLGWSYGVDSPNVAGNTLVFTQRILDYINGLIDDGGTSRLKYSTFVNGAWTTPTLAPDGDPTTATGDGNPANQDVRNFILSKVMQFYVGMEVGHSVDLTPTVQGTNKTSYGYHYAPFTGDCLDQAITNKVKSGFNTFYIPSLCSSTDLSQFLISP